MVVDHAKKAPIDMPKHIAIVMDGNRRWAKKNGKHSITGHRQGAEALRRITTAVSELGIPFLTVYAFSTENWNRSYAEVKALTMLLKRYLEREVAGFIEKKVKLNVIGDISKYPPKIQELLCDVQARTSKDYEVTLTLALNYGGRNEICRATNKILENCISGTLKPGEVDEDRFNSYLDGSDLPDLDLFIRTGGERRLSNFMLWQISYAEIYFTDIMWPEFNKEHLIEAIKEYQARERRHGR